MRFALLAGALAVDPCCFELGSRQFLRSSTYHGSLDRAGHYVMPGLTYERARGLHLDPSFNATFRGEVYAQPLLWREPGSARAC